MKDRRPGRNIQVSQFSNYRHRNVGVGVGGGSRNGDSDGGN